MLEVFFFNSNLNKRLEVSQTWADLIILNNLTTSYMKDSRE